MAHVTVQFEVSLWRARVWIRAMQLAAFVVGHDRAWRWASAGVLRLARYRLVGDKRWSGVA